CFRLIRQTLVNFIHQKNLATINRRTLYFAYNFSDFLVVPMLIVTGAGHKLELEAGFPRPVYSEWKFIAVANCRALLPCFQ
ncbi:hypothetical protein, partial [Coleofasciculus sp. FACHB-712]|uniref:hypothetical protein n=1 Tax=Coleofasciculus sp. FACHB-712 TaxID=2692789 RepID=UPI001A7F0FDA